jgi:transcriptional regulator with XRE-family HTH domain
MTEPTNRLLELRTARNLSRVAIAAHLDIGEHQVRRWESGTLIPTKYLAPLSEFFGVSTDHLLGLDRDDTRAAA